MNSDSGCGRAIPVVAMRRAARIVFVAVWAVASFVPGATAVASEPGGVASPVFEWSRAVSWRYDGSNVGTTKARAVLSAVSVRNWGYDRRVESLRSAEATNSALWKRPFERGLAFCPKGVSAFESGAGIARPAAAIDDPLIDNNILAHLAGGDRGAIKFAEKYKGLLSVDETVATEFMRGGQKAGLPGRSALELDDLMTKYGIELRSAASEAEALAVVRARGGSVVRADDYIVAVAKRDGIRFATGDNRALISAIKSGVDARFWNFEAGTVAFRYKGAINKLRGNGFNPRDYLGPLNPW